MCWGVAHRCPNCQEIDLLVITYDCLNIGCNSLRQTNKNRFVCKVCYLLNELALKHFTTVSPPPPVEIIKISRSERQPFLLGTLDTALHETTLKMENEKKSDPRINLVFHILGYLHTETANLKRLNYFCLNELVNMKCEQQKQKQKQNEKLRLQAKRRREHQKNALKAKLV